MSSHSTYAEIYSKKNIEDYSNNLKFSSIPKMQDSNAYISFLETQLDKVSSFCLTIESFNSKLEDINLNIKGMEDRFANLSRLNNIQQKQLDINLKEVNEIKDKIKVMDKTIVEYSAKKPSAIEERAKVINFKISEMDYKIGRIEEKYSEINDSLVKHEELLDFLKSYKDIGGKIAKIDQKIIVN